MKNQTSIIKNPRVTEKASFYFEKNVYTFNVTDSATKNEIKKAIFSLFKVTPTKINIVNMPKKITSYRGKKSLKDGGKKAYVHLKEGDKIELN
jgi:large subunit ribosomal protein L23